MVKPAFIEQMERITQADLKRLDEPWMRTPRITVLSVAKPRLRNKAGRWGRRIKGTCACAYSTWKRGSRAAHITLVLDPSGSLQEGWQGDLQHEIDHGVMHANGIPSRRHHSLQKKFNPTRL